MQLQNSFSPAKFIEALKKQVKQFAFSHFTVNQERFILMQNWSTIHRVPCITASHNVTEMISIYPKKRLLNEPIIFANKEKTGRKCTDLIQKSFNFHWFPIDFNRTWIYFLWGGISVEEPKHETSQWTHFHVSYVEL